MTSIKNFLFLFIILLTGLLSCKKDKVEKPSHPLSGEWQLTDTEGYFTRVIFGEGNNFSYVISSKDWSMTTAVLGSFTTDENKLTITVNKRLVQEKGKETILVTSDTPFFDQATFSIEDKTLTLNYTTYPADAPVPTTLKLTRALSLKDDTH
ncbi:hypothetical protein LPB86_09965 [Pedobacter sp. MC2016-14]|uniref:hypothetical protein n=1 Tax=Pedobacter sp. MC2016-14 TaxID=2897327 RepID=UPI001E484CAD|nr:hypothetical protein [Pedobacter sp. MC2016-14]MCD0488557.1 hypothetical protein [Pedobacter sp. MC2016-14]